MYLWAIKDVCYETKIEKKEDEEGVKVDEEEGNTFARFPPVPT